MLSIKWLSGCFLFFSFLFLANACNKTQKATDRQGFLFINYQNTPSPLSSLPANIQSIDLIDNTGKAHPFRINRSVDLAARGSLFLAGLSIPEREYIGLQLNLDYTDTQASLFKIQDEYDPIAGHWDFLQLVDSEGAKIPQDMRYQSIGLSFQKPLTIEYQKSRFISLEFFINESLIPSTQEQGSFIFHPDIAVQNLSTTTINTKIIRFEKNLVTLLADKIELSVPTPSIYIDGTTVEGSSDTSLLNGQFAQLRLGLDKYNELYAESLNVVHRSHHSGQIIPTMNGIAFSGHIREPDGTLTFINDLPLPTIEPDENNKIDVQKLKPGQLIEFAIDDALETNAIALLATDLIAETILDANENVILLPLSIDGKDAKNFYAGTIAIDNSLTESFKLGDLIRFTGMFKGEESGVTFIPLDHQFIDNSLTENSAKNAIQIDIQPKRDIASGDLKIIQNNADIEIPLDQFDEHAGISVKDLSSNITINVNIETLKLTTPLHIALKTYRNTIQTTSRFSNIDEMQSAINTYYPDLSLFQFRLTGSIQGTVFVSDHLELFMRDTSRIVNTAEDETIALEAEKTKRNGNNDDKKKWIIGSVGIAGAAALLLTGIHFLKPKSPSAVVPNPVNPVISNTQTPAPQTPKPTTTWKKVAGQKGTQEGGVYQDDEGVNWYIKPQTQDQANNEVLASKLYQLAGINAMNYEFMALDEKTKQQFGTTQNAAVRSRLIETAQINTSDPNLLKTYPDITKGFVVDAWLANWDVVGLAYDNLFIDTQTNKAIRLDFGGALRYRAQGQPKNDQLTNEVKEVDSLRDPQKNATAAQLFKNINEEQIKEGVDSLSQIKAKDIEALIEKYGPVNSAEKKALKERLILRRIDLMSKFTPELIRLNELKLYLEKKYNPDFSALSTKGSDYDKALFETYKTYLLASQPKEVKDARQIATKYGKNILMRQSEFSSEEQQTLKQSIKSFVDNQTISLKDLSKPLLEELTSQDKIYLSRYFENKYGNDFIKNIPLFSLEDITIYNANEQFLDPNKKALTNNMGELENYFIQKYGRDHEYWLLQSDRFTNEEQDKFFALYKFKTGKEPIVDNIPPPQHFANNREQKARFIIRLKRTYGDQWINQIEHFTKNDYETLNQHFPYILNKTDKTKLKNDLEAKYGLNYTQNLGQLSTDDFQKHLKVAFKPSDLKDVKFFQPDNDNVQYVFRADSRPPEDIFKYGFSPKGNNLDFLLHNSYKFDGSSAYIPTTKSLEITAKFLNDNKGQEYIYVIEKTDDLESIDSNQWIKKHHAKSKITITNEQELAVKRIPNYRIRAVLSTPEINPLKAQKRYEEGHARPRTFDWETSPAWLSNPFYKKAK